MRRRKSSRAAGSRRLKRQGNGQPLEGAQGEPDPGQDAW